MKKLIFVFVLFVLQIHAGTIFKDDFSSDKSWVALAGSPAIKATGNKLNLNNSSSSSVSVVVHNDANVAALSSFTYSAVFKKESATSDYAGLFFCMQGGSLEGYMFAVQKNKQYSLIKWIKNGDSFSYVTLAVDWNSFIDDSANILTVSKDGNKISLFCNDVFLDEVIDTTYDKGDIGLSVGAAENVNVSSLVFSDIVQKGEPKKMFWDHFSDDDINGWRKLTGNGSYSESGGKLFIESADTAMILYTNGNYASVACTTVVNYESGDTNALYGIALLRVVPSQVTIADYFLINADRKYVLFTNSTQGAFKTNSVITGVSDTIVVTADKHFIVNGSLIDDKTFSDTTDFNAIGLYGDPEVKVGFDDFRAIPLGSGINFNIKNQKFSKTGSVGYELGGTGIVVDLRGRKVADFNSSGYGNLFQSLGTGPYFIVERKDRKMSVRRAIINIK